MAQITMETRTTSPSKTNKYYIHTSGGGYNKCIKIDGNDCLPNCVGYAYGRFLEEAKISKANLPTCNAEDWYATAKERGFEVSKTPSVGAIIVWKKGKTRTSSDGCGHVAVVEKVYDDGSILISQSGYGCSRFWTTKLAAPYKMAGYELLGFIKNPKIVNKITSTKISYTKGKTYKVVCSGGLNVRKSADTSGKKVKTLAKGTKVTCQGMKGNWMKIAKNQWICCKQGADIYVK